MTHTIYVSLAPQHTGYPSPYPQDDDREAATVIVPSEGWVIRNQVGHYPPKANGMAAGVLADWLDDNEELCLSLGSDPLALRKLVDYLWRSFERGGTY